MESNEARFVYRMLEISEPEPSKFVANQLGVISASLEEVWACGGKLAPYLFLCLPHLRPQENMQEAAPRRLPEM